MGGKKNASPTRATPQQTQAPAKVAPVAPKPVADATAPLGSRKSDLFFVLTYLGWFKTVFVVFLASCSHLLPATFHDVEFAKPVCEALATLEGPLRPLLEVHQQWGDKVFSMSSDFALKLINCVNLFILGPVAPLLALGFLFGYKWVKNVAIIHASFMLYTMIIADIYAYKALHADNATQTPGECPVAKLAAAIVYGFFTIFPICVINRVWSSAPFSLKNRTQKRGFIMGFFWFWVKLALFCWMMGTVVTVYEFSIKHTGSMKHLPSVLEHGQKHWEHSQPHRDQLMVHAAEFQVVASKKIKEYGAITKEFVNDLGERVLEWAQNLNKKEETKAKQAPPKAKPTPPKEAPKKDEL